jgi:putative FmdB family regulatory protein
MELTLPLYEYQCRSCRKTADVRHGFKETFDGKCEACGGEMARVYSPAGIVFKGSGFYLTDSRKAAEAASSASTSKSSSTSDSSTTTPAAGSDTSSSSTTTTPAPAATAASTPAAPAATPAPSKSESAA